jgi:hypothetical protein
LGALGPDDCQQLQPQERHHGADQQLHRAWRATAARYDTNPNGYSWTDGTPTASATNSPTGLYINGLNKGFQITVPADTTSRTVKVYVGVWGAQGKLEATLSDSSASAYVDTSVTDPGGSSDGIARVYTLTYRAGVSESNAHGQVDGRDDA